jgi:hypothetical protein
MALPSLLLGILLFQGPGDGWVLVPDTRQVKKLYWDLFQTTEVWVRLIPQDPEGKPPLVSLIFQAFFSGKPERDPYTGQPRDPKGPPSKLELRAQPLPLTVVNQLTLKLVVDDKTVDLTAPGAAYRNLYPCPDGECAANAVAAEIDPPRLRALIKAKLVKGEVLGIPIRLTPDDQRALAELATRIGVD